MNCQEGVGRLMEYTDGALQSRVRLAMEAHVRRCVRCRRFVRSYCDTPRIVKEATTQKMPEGVRRRLRAALAARLRRSDR